jgi:hypothetical protein
MGMIWKIENPSPPGCKTSNTPQLPIITAITRLLPMCSLKKIAEKTRTKIGEVKRPAPASAMGIIGITPK